MKLLVKLENLHEYQMLVQSLSVVVDLAMISAYKSKLRRNKYIKIAHSWLRTIGKHNHITR